MSLIKFLLVSVRPRLFYVRASIEIGDGRAAGASPYSRRAPRVCA